MKNKFVSLLFGVFFTLNVFAQHQITGRLKPIRETRSILMYKTEGAFQYYKASTSVDSTGMFGFILPKGFPSGNYKLIYDAQNDLAINVIYNNEDISMVFDPKDALNTIFFYNSENNSVFYDYVQTISEKYDELELIQKTYYKNKEDSTTSVKTIKKYIFKLNQINAFQTHFEKESKGLIAKSYIQAFQKPLNKKPFETKEEKYDFLKNNYLKGINFQDTILRNSAFLIDRLNEYVFDLNEAIAVASNTALDTKMVSDALALIEKSKFKDEIIYSLTSSAFDPYMSQYDQLLDFLYNNYYKQLPTESKNKKFTEMVIAKLNAIVGKKAPNIYFGGDDLYSIQSDSVLIIFWSSTCSHCLKEIPEIYKLLLENKTTKVVLIGLEDEYSDWERVSKPFANWKNIRANGKWTNENALNYNVKGTPAYFLLDKNKTIIAKPENINDIKEIF